MNRNGIRKIDATGKRDILFNTKRQGYSVQVAATGVTNKDADDHLIIYAGQALGAATDPRVDRQTPLTLVAAAPAEGTTVYGVTQHDIVFLSADEICNANLLFMATIDTAKLDEKALVPDEVKAVLETGGPTKVTFVNGAPQVVGPVTSGNL